MANTDFHAIIERSSKIRERYHELASRMNIDIKDALDTFLTKTENLLGK